MFHKASQKVSVVTTSHSSYRTYRLPIAVAAQPLRLGAFLFRLGWSWVYSCRNVQTICWRGRGCVRGLFFPSLFSFFLSPNLWVLEKTSKQYLLFVCPQTYFSRIISMASHSRHIQVQPIRNGRRTRKLLWKWVATLLWFRSGNDPLKFYANCMIFIHNFCKPVLRALEASPSNKKSMLHS